MSKVDHNAARRRFELSEDPESAFLQYRRSGEAFDLLHTEVSPDLEGQGVGSTLVKAAFEEAERAGVKVIPSCSFVRGYVDRHPEYRRLIAN